MTAFTRKVFEFYERHRRHMPWRTDTRPYYIVVSEIMLQQTQVDRVMKKFPAFIRRFPDWQALAKASTKDVLEEWSGLGYNRRALYLKRIAEMIGTDELPQTYDKLRKFPGIGPNTAGSILAFAWNIPHPFIETNIRSVYIHHFFPKKKKIADALIMPLITKTLAHETVRKNAREWYWALMDYGSHLKSIEKNPSRQSKHHIKQKPFKGSNREVRSQILQTVMKKALTHRLLEKRLARVKTEILEKNLRDLEKEGFIRSIHKNKQQVYQIAS